MKFVRFSSQFFLALALSGLLSGADSSTPAGPTPQESTDIAALRNKAERGNPIAQYNLGLALAQRRQHAADLPEAFVWLTLAGERGSRHRALDALLSELTPAQLTDGRARLAEVRATHPEFSTPAPRASAAVSNDAVSQVVLDVLAPAAPAAPPPAPSTSDVDEKRQLAQELSSAWKESERLQAELTTARADLDQSRKTLAAASAEHTARLAEYAKTSAANSADLALAQNDSAAARAALAETQARMAALTANQTRLETERAELLAFAKAPPPPDPELARLRTQLTESAAHLVRSEADLAHAREQASALESTQRLLAATGVKLSEAVQQADTLKQEISARTLAASNAVAQVADLESRLSRQQMELAALTSEHNDAVAQRGATAAVEARAQQLAAANAELVAKTGVLLEERTQLAGRVAELNREHQASVASAQSRITELTTTQIRLETERAELIASIKNSPPPDPDTARLRTQLEESIARAQRAEAGLVHAREQAVALDATQRMLGTSEARLRELSEHVETLKQEVAARSQSVTQAVAQVTELQSRLAHQQVELEAMASARDQAVAKATALATTEVAARDLAATNAELSASLAAAAQERSGFINRIAALEKERDIAAAETSARLADATRELGDVRRELAAAQSAQAESETKLRATATLADQASGSVVTIAQLTAARDALAVRAATAASAASEAAKLREQLAVLSAKDEAAATELKRATARTVELVAENDQLRLAIAKADARRVPDLQDELETAQRRAAETELKLNTTSTELAALRSQAAANTESAAHLRQLEADNAALVVKLAAAQTPSAPAAELSALRSRAETAERVAMTLQAELGRTNQLLAGERTARRQASAPTRPTVGTASAIRTVTATAVSPAATPEGAPAARTHTIVFGDTLSGISLRYYGTANRWREIFAANRTTLRDERSLVAGRVLEIP